MGLGTDPPGRRRRGLFGWPGALGVGVIIAAGAWLWTQSAWQTAVGGLTAVVTWYAVHRLGERRASHDGQGPPGAPEGRGER